MSDIILNSPKPLRSSMVVPKSSLRIECLETPTAFLLPPMAPIMPMLIIIAANMKNRNARKAPTNEPHTIRINFFIITV